MGPMFGTVEDYGEMFQDNVVQTKDASLSTTNQIGNPVVYKLVRVAGDGRLVPVTDEEIFEVKDFLENNENDDKPIVPEPGQIEEYIPGGESEGYIPSEGSPSQLLQLESLQGLFQSETPEAYTEDLNSQLETKEELMYGSQMLFTLPDNKFQISNEFSGNEEYIQSEAFLQEPIPISTNGCITNQFIDVIPYSDAADTPKEPAFSTPASNPDFCRVSGQMSLDNLSIKALQETFRATFGRETTVKDKPWLKRRITMGLTNSCVVPTSNLPIEDNKLLAEGHETYLDIIDGISMDMVVEGRTTNFKDTPSSPEGIKGHSHDFLYSPVETLGDHYYGNEDFEGEHRPAKRVRKLTRRYIEENSKTDEKQQSDESMNPLEDQRSTGPVSSGGRAVVTRMLSLGGSSIQVPYVCHGRRSRPRENIMALGEFHPCSREVKAMPEESNLILSPTRLNNDLNRVSGVKPVSAPVQKESNKDDPKPILTEMDQGSTQSEPSDSCGDSSDDNSNHVDRPIKQDAVIKKHHRAWSLLEVTKLVEGVSKHGVGKWSEIKKHSSSSFSRRTPVDLKDKWRNLLKANFSSSQPNKMGILRKQGSAIPDHIMLKVQELVQKHSLVSPRSRGARMAKGSRNEFL